MCVTTRAHAHPPACASIKKYIGKQEDIFSFHFFHSWAAWQRNSLGLVPPRESSVQSYLVGNAGSRLISEAKQPWACLVLGWGTTGEAHVLYSPLLFSAEKNSEVGCQ